MVLLPHEVDVCVTHENVSHAKSNQAFLHRRFYIDFLILNYKSFIQVKLYNYNYINLNYYS